MDNAQEQRRRYPVGIQTFSKIRQGNYVYVDKTALVYRLANESDGAFFLSRPRRFGKSLLVSTLQAYFEGRRDLFSWLKIEKLESTWERYPVIRLDLSTVKTRDPEILLDLLDAALSFEEAQWGRDNSMKTPGSRLMGLIRRACAQTGKPVVVLVDEYDAPLLNVVDDPQKLPVFQDVMREFFAPLKACDEYLRFVFITGITKFAQLSIFSELNNLTNISMQPEYAAICGITEEELVTQLSQDVDELSGMLGIDRAGTLGALKRQYDGYHFCDPSPDIYNPYSLLGAFRDSKIGDYWFATGTPTFLVDLLKKQEWDISTLESCQAREEEFDVPAQRMRTPLPMLYQGGYLTIKGYDALTHTFTLGIPNEEVSRGLSKSLVEHASPDALREHYSFLDTFSADLRTGDIEHALKGMRAYLASIPYHLGSRDERGFQTKFYLIFDLLGIQIETEFKTATGRIDAVVKTDDTTYVMEFKYNKTPEEALSQIDAKDYALPFSADGRQLVKVGVNFSEREQTIDGWVVEDGTDGS